MNDLTKEQLIDLLTKESAALKFAIRVIESYAFDIRDSQWTGVDLVAVGFCQGAIYTEALKTIAQIQAGKAP